MAQSEINAERKARLIAELRESRADLATSLHGVRQSLDVTAHLKRSFAKQKFAWLTGAAVTGLLVTRLARRPKAVRATPTVSSSSKPDKNGLLLGALGLLFSMLRPTLTSLATQKLAEFMATRGGAAFEPEPPHRVPPRR